MSPHSHLKIDGIILTNKKDVNEVVSSMTEISGASYTARFPALLAEQEQRPMFFSRAAAEYPYKLPFLYRKMNSALQLYIRIEQVTIFHNK